MCGIIGQFNPDGPDAERIERASELIRHRGPDDTGSFSDGPFTCAFRRLAILDLSPAGHQPMQSADGSLCVLHNGEIYNYLELRAELQRLGHRFRSQSDTEVILAAYREWGTSCFERMNGMWAMVLWDRRSKKLILSRDRFGEKPLYYWRRAEVVTFGSEMKAIFAAVNETPPPNRQMVFDFLAYGFHDHTEETFFSGIRQIAPGSFIVISDGVIETRRYWSLTPATSAVRTIEEAGERFRQLFTESIKIRLRSDVPIGTCLSGGLDSSSIAIIAHRLLGSSAQPPRQKTFTAYADDPRYDERAYSRLVVEAVGAESHEVAPSALRFRDEAEAIMRHQEEPYLSMSIFAQWEVMRLARENGVTVMLDGQGGDEVLAGYIPFFASLVSERLRRGDLIGFVRETRAFLGRHRASLAHVLPTFALYSLPRWLGGALMRAVPRDEISTLERRFRTTYFRYPETPRPYPNRFKSHLHRLLTSTGVRALLHYEDRNAMAFSIESRVPFLDHRLAEFTLGLPDHFLMGNGEAKRLLRTALKGTLPEPIRNRHEKMGFVVPQEDWLRNELAPTWGPLLRNDNARINEFVDRAARRAMVDRFSAGETRLHTLLWRWYNLETWLKVFHG